MAKRERKIYVNVHSYLDVTFKAVETNQIELSGIYTTKKGKKVNVKLTFYDWEVPEYVKKMTGIVRDRYEAAATLLQNVRNSVDK